MGKVKVRVAVAVDPTGNWNASGCKALPNEETMQLAVEPLWDGEARYWLEAELDIPEVKTLTANVTKDVPLGAEANIG